jgi:O-antigen ligase/cytochrome c-type biogenesis protein CcmH/NrfG
MSFAERILRWIVIGGIFALPAVALIVADGLFFPNLFFPYITGKNFAFRVIVEIITGSWLALALCIPRYRPKRQWILAAFGLFVIIIAIADAQGVNPFKSFWSNFERMDGWVTIVHVLLLIAVAASTLDTEKIWRRFFNWSLIVSFFLSILGFFQVLGTFTIGSGGTGLESRIDVTFGNPIYLAVYMLFHVFLAALLLYQLRRDTKGDHLWLSVWYWAVIVFDTLALFLSGTRGAMLGLIGGGVLTIALYVFTREGRHLRRWAVGVCAVLLVLAGGLWVGRDSVLVHRVGFLNRLAGLYSLTGDDTTMARLINIEMAWRGVKERPVLGWGQENYAIVFDKYYDPRMYAQEQWFDRVHNIVFDWWIAGGTLGLLAYLSIFAAALYGIWRKGVLDSGERSIFTGLLAGYFIHNLTVFDNVTSYILFAFVLGYVCFREAKAREIRPVSERALVAGDAAVPIAGAVGLIVALGSAWMVNAYAYAANTEILNALYQGGNVSAALQSFEKAISYGTYGTQEAREQLSQLAASVAQSSSISQSDKEQVVQIAVDQLNLQAKQSPLDARFPLFAGSILDVAGDSQQAEALLMRAHELSPDKQSILYELAQNAQQRGDTSGMVRYLKTAYELDTANTDARIGYAAGLISAGEDSAAAELLAPIVETGQAADPRIAQAYAARHEYANLVPIWQAAIKADPAKAQNYFTLAAIYYAAGNAQKAIATLQQVSQLVPSVAADVAQYIQQIKTGTVSTH